MQTKPIPLGRTLAVGLLTGVPAAASLLAEPPANDSFLNPPALFDSESGFIPLAEATAEPDEPAHGGFPAEHSVWWGRTLPPDREYWLTIEGPSHCDLAAAVYRQSGSDPVLADAVRITDVFRPASGIWMAAVRFQTGPGGRAWIVLDAKGDPGDGRYRLALVNTPPDTVTPAVNDDFANAAEWPAAGFHGPDSGRDLSSRHDVSFPVWAATAEPGEPGHHAPRAERSLWYRWTAPADGTVVLAVSGSTHSQNHLATYVGGSLATLQRVSVPVPPIRDLFGRILAVFPARQGNTYWLAADVVNATAFPQASGTVFQTDDNDDFNRRQAVGWTNGVATREFWMGVDFSGPAGQENLAAAPMWFELTIPESGAYDLGRRLGEVDLFQGDTLESLTPVPTFAGRDMEGLRRFIAAAGEKLVIRVSAPAGWEPNFHGVAHGWTIRRQPRFDPVDTPALRLRRRAEQPLPGSVTAGRLSLEFTGRPLRLYQVETSTDLREWKPWRSVVLPEPEVSVDLGDGGGAGPWFRVTVPE